MEIFKDVVGYSGSYQVSNLGRVKSFTKKNYIELGGKTLKLATDKDGYKIASLTKNKKATFRGVHQLVCEAFIGYEKGIGLVPNHINLDKSDNRLKNLEIVSIRENSNRKHIKSSSVYVGVSWYKLKKEWVSRINVGRVKIYLGYFTNELEASNRYQLALKHINEYNGNAKEFRKYLVNLC